MIFKPRKVIDIHQKDPDSTSLENISFPIWKASKKQLGRNGGQVNSNSVYYVAGLKISHSATGKILKR